MPLPFTFPSSRASSSDANRPGLKWHLLHHPVKTASLPEAITAQISTELYELIIDHLRDDVPSLLACTRVCRSWAPRSKCLLLQLKVCSPVPVVSHGGFGRITCAVPDEQGLAVVQTSPGNVIYGTTEGVYRASKDGSRPRLLSGHNVSWIAVLPDANLFLCLAGGVFMSVRLSILNAGACRDTDISRIATNVSFFAVYRRRTAREPHRVCVLKSSALSSTLKVFDVIAHQQLFTLQLALELYIPSEIPWLRFASPTKLVAALKRGSGSPAKGGFELVDLPTFETQALLDLNDPALEFTQKKLKPLMVFRASGLFLLCYDKLGFYISGRGTMARPELLMRWKSPATAFALHEPHLLVVSDARNIETGEAVQKVVGPLYQ
ncbi:CNH domain-containing protein [Mycena belliarum]|uniref:CNH domain-containing protein n=1 Tax=Mycena belliarum TaxID=1033014 RepID=A0AAD6TP52_9AGAR|nr:CNH domain-containing protein [Mycena belliae]